MKNMKMNSDGAKHEAYPMGDDEGPKYPYGLKICLNEECIAKLEMASMPDVGTTLNLSAVVEVCEVGQYQKENGEKERRLDLQITDMELMAAKEEKTAEQTLYGG